MIVENLARIIVTILFFLNWCPEISRCQEPVDNGNTTIPGGTNVGGDGPMNVTDPSVNNQTVPGNGGGEGPKNVTDPTVDNQTVPSNGVNGNETEVTSKPDSTGQTNGLLGLILRFGRQIISFLRCMRWQWSQECIEETVKCLRKKNWRNCIELIVCRKQIGAICSDLLRNGTNF